jgi:hypothetical protein
MWFYVLSTMLIPGGLFLVYYRRSAKFRHEQAYNHCQLAQTISLRNRTHETDDVIGMHLHEKDNVIFENDSYRIQYLQHKTRNRRKLGVYVKPDDQWLSIESVIVAKDSSCIRVETRYFLCKKNFGPPQPLLKPLDIDIAEVATYRRNAIDEQSSIITTA